VNSKDSTRNSERGETGLIGAVLLIVLVSAGAVIVLWTGSGAVAQIEQQQSNTDAGLALEEVDQRLTALTSEGETSQRQFSLGDLNRGEARLVRDGYLNVTVNRNGTCASEARLSSIRYEGDDDTVVAYEAGGVWETSVYSNETSLRTPPDVGFRNGSLDVTVTNITGTIGSSPNVLEYDANRSQNVSTGIATDLFQGECVRPNNVTIRVQSEFYRGWATHLEDEFGIEPTVYDHNRTVRILLEQSDLPRRADDSRNRVIDLSNRSSYMENVSAVNNTLRVTKDNTATYRVFAEPLVESRLQIGQLRVVENATNVTRPAQDVVFVIDESGSMGDPADSSCASSCKSKRTAAQDAAQNFTAILNSSKDRVGLVGFYQYADGQARYFPINGRYMTSDFDAFNGTVATTAANGGTYIWAGLRDANAVHGMKSTQTRDRVVVLLSDGANNGYGPAIHGTSYSENEATEQYADLAGQMGTTIHSIGFGDGSEFNETLLRYVNGTTGGQYYEAENAAELNDAFQDIARRITSTEQFARTPATTNFTTDGGQFFGPQIAGDTSDIANVSESGNTLLNINDPTAPTVFTHSFTVADNETVTFNASTYGCSEWEGTDTQPVEFNGTSYPVTRCANMTTASTTISAENTTIYTDGDNFNDTLKSYNASEVVQDDLNDTIASNPDVRLNATNHLQLASNQAVVVMDFPNSPDSANKLVLLYQMGLPDTAAVASDIINFRVEKVDVK
jgi:Mg-chelatase subunit ChlD